MTANLKSTIAVLGAGSWGTALALLLARNGHTVLLWGHVAVQQERLERERQNRAYLPDIAFPANIQVHASLPEAAKSISRFLVAVPSHAFRATLTALGPLMPNDAILAWATKGLEPGSGKLLSQVAIETLGGRHARAVISGPTFAREVALNMPTALTVASENEKAAEEVASWLRNERVRVYTSRDVAGVQLGGAIKNVMAIAAGISDGAGFGDNTKAAIMTRGIYEITRLGVKMGAKPITFAGLSGIGDLIVTCMSRHSRNRFVGEQVGKGRKLDDVVGEMIMVAEGVATSKAIHELSIKHRIDMPMASEVYKVLFEGKDPYQATFDLMTRDAKGE